VKYNLETEYFLNNSYISFEYDQVLA